MGEKNSDFLVKLAKQGLLDAQKILAQKFLLVNNITDAITWLTITAERGDAWSQYKLGWLYMYENHCADKEKATYWLNKASEQGYNHAHFLLGKHYMLGYERTYNKASEKSNIIEIRMLGYQKDYNKSLELFNRAEINFDENSLCKLMKCKAGLYKTMSRSTLEYDYYIKYVNIVRLFSQKGLGCSVCKTTDNYDANQRVCPWMVDSLCEHCRETGGDAIDFEILGELKENGIHVGYYGYERRERGGLYGWYNSNRSELSALHCWGDNEIEDAFYGAIDDWIEGVVQKEEEENSDYNNACLSEMYEDPQESDRPDYNDNLDIDQQSMEFWDSL